MSTPLKGEELHGTDSSAPETAADAAKQPASANASAEPDPREQDNRLLGTVSEMQGKLAEAESAFSRAQELPEDRRVAGMNAAIGTVQSAHQQLVDAIQTHKTTASETAASSEATREAQRLAAAVQDLKARSFENALASEGSTPPVSTSPSQAQPEPMKFAVDGKDLEPVDAEIVPNPWSDETPSVSASTPLDAEKEGYEADDVLEGPLVNHGPLFPRGLDLDSAGRSQGAFGGPVRQSPTGLPAGAPAGARTQAGASTSSAAGNASAATSTSSAGSTGWTSSTAQAPNTAAGTGGAQPGGATPQSSSSGGGSTPQTPSPPAGGGAQTGPQTNADLRAAWSNSAVLLRLAQVNRDQRMADPANQGRALHLFKKDAQLAEQAFKLRFAQLLKDGSLTPEDFKWGELRLRTLERFSVAADQRAWAYSMANGSGPTTGQNSPAAGSTQSPSQNPAGGPSPASAGPTGNPASPADPFAQVAQNLGPQLFGQKAPLNFGNQPAQSGASPAQQMPAQVQNPQQQQPAPGPSVADLQRDKDELEDRLKRLEAQQGWNPGFDGAAAGGQPRVGIIGRAGKVIGGAGKVVVATAGAVDKLSETMPVEGAEIFAAIMNPNFTGGGGSRPSR